MNRQGSLKAVAMATAVLCSSVAGGASAQANPQLPSGFTLGPSADYAREDWAPVGRASDGNLAVTIGVNWRSYDRFGENYNMRSIYVIVAGDRTDQDGTDYMIVNMVFSCGQPMMSKITSTSFYSLESNLLEPTQQFTDNMSTINETSPYFVVGSRVCSVDRPDSGDYSSARDFVLSVR
jgi:hypothetical protein